MGNMRVNGKNSQKPISRFILFSFFFFPFFPSYTEADLSFHSL